MGLAKKMEWLKWIRKYSTGILDTRNSSSMETLIDPTGSKNVNYAYKSSVISDDEFINAVEAVAIPQQQRPMLPPPQTLDNLPSPPQLPNDVYDCCVSLDGIPIKHEFQYTLSDTDGYGKITKHDVEGLASKILESMYGTTGKLSSPRGRHTVKVTLNVVPSSSTAAVQNNRAAVRLQSSSDGRKNDSPSMAAAAASAKPSVLAESPVYADMGYLPSAYVVKGSSSRKRRDKPGAQRYRHEQLIEMVQRSLAENLSFQTERESVKPEACEDYYRPRTKRRQSASAQQRVQDMALQKIPLPSPPISKPKSPAAKVAWSPYDFEPVAHVPSNNYHFHEQLKNHRRYQQQQRQKLLLYGGGNDGRAAAVVKSSQRGHGGGGGRGQRQQHRTAAAAAIVGGKDVTAEEQQRRNSNKNTDHQRYKRAKQASKKIHHHIHEHHHYHHYDYYVL